MLNFEGNFCFLFFHDPRVLSFFRLGDFSRFCQISLPEGYVRDFFETSIGKFSAVLLYLV